MREERKGSQGEQDEARAFVKCSRHQEVRQRGAWEILRESEDSFGSASQTW